MSDADPNAAFEHAVAQRIRERERHIAAWMRAMLVHVPGSEFARGHDAALTYIAIALTEGEVP